jgi:hypothetical protein
MRRWIILMTLLVMVVAAIAGWQEIKSRDEEAHTKVLWNQLTGTNDLSSLAECIEKREYGMDIEKCVEIEATINKTLGR